MNIISCINMYNFTWILALSRTVSRYWDSGPQLESMPYRWSNSSPHSKSTEYVIYRIEQHWATTCKHTHTHNSPTNDKTNQYAQCECLSQSYCEKWFSNILRLNKPLLNLEFLFTSYVGKPLWKALEIVRKQGSTDDVRQWPSYRLWQNKMNAGFWLGLSKMDKCFNEAPTSDQFLNEKRFWFAND